MDASASQVDADFKDVYSFFLKIENSAPLRQKNTVIKYTKIPEFDLDARGTWPRSNYKLEPRLRRIITLEDPEVTTSRSLKTSIPPKSISTNISTRKIVTISEDDEYDLHPKFSKDTKKSSVKQINRSAATDINENTQSSYRTSSQQITPKYLLETKSAKSNNASDRKEIANKTNSKNISLNINKLSSENMKPKNVKNKEPIGNFKSVTSRSSNISKTHVESEKDTPIKSKINDNLKSNLTKKNYERSKVRSSAPNKSLPSFAKEAKKHKTPLHTIIHVPLEDKNLKRNVSTKCIITSRATEASSKENISEAELCPTSHAVSETPLLKDMNVGTEPALPTIEQATETDVFLPQLTQKSCRNVDVQTELIRETELIESLDIPNVSLKTDKSEKIYNETLDIQTMSLPNLSIPNCQITSNRSDKSLLDTHYCTSTSYIISKATLTYKTKQKINFHVVGSDNTYSNQSPSPLSYPMNVVSAFKEESNTEDIRNKISLEEEHTGKSSKEIKNCINEIKSLDCSYVSNSNKLMKPSDIISTITVNNGLLQSDFICEQFQRELNFIDSFFESLQYLESCSLADKCFKDDEALVNETSLIASGLDVDNAAYENFFSRFDNIANSDDSQTMASKNLLLLNILIRDEQRRAKNLLFVLKRREDALKDFTKSQILYLESKKKHDNTDISALKKKQRGALLKLQHECGEMQRMRKALLTLSEKRKVALMKTKKDLELKLNNNVDVEQIILVKKKLKRNTGVDRVTVPLKCFDLSSSGCEDSATSRASSESTSSPSEAPVLAKTITAVEKSIQTGDSISEGSVADGCPDTAAEHFVVVDGGYLNILFHDLSLPQIFSGQKQYEVNEEALKNIVNSSNRQPKHDDIDGIERLMEQINNWDTIEAEKSSTPSTARSLVEEFDQYYRGLTENEKSFEEDSECKTPPRVSSTAVVCELTDVVVQASNCTIEEDSDGSIHSGSAETLVESAFSADKSCECKGLDEVKLVAVTSMTQPHSPPPELPGEPPDVPHPPPVEQPSPHWFQPDIISSDTTFESSSVSSLCEMSPSMTSLAAPVQTEAEELRRQQLAIEEEIKELEQQQCRLLVVREIPDKPPPPYTPPGDIRPKPPRAFRPDDVACEQIRTIVTDPTTLVDNTDPFDVFIKDFCHDTIKRLKPKLSDKPWDSCNLLPQKPPPDTEKVIESTSSDLIDVLAGVTPATASGVSSRRSDHIDDILFAEWHRIEPQWTSLHTDEAHVKNQLFDTIFQRLLSETVDEYKKSVLSE